SADPACNEDPAGTVGCKLSALLPGQTTSVGLSVRAPARCEGGLPVPIVNNASVANDARYAGPDPDAADNDASASTAVKDTTAPVLTLAASPSVLWPPNHKFVPVTITVVTADACDDDPTIRLVSITSNEPADGQGDGNTSPDVRNARIGKDDRRVNLRAERS